MSATSFTRRGFLGAATATVGAVAAGGLVVGCSGTPDAPRLVAGPAAASELGSWVHITPDDRVILTMASTEMGQGATTGLAQLMVEQLGAAWNTVEARQAPLDAAFANPMMRSQMTGGSASIRMLYTTVATVAAAAREMLVAAAATRLGVEAAALTVRDGTISDGTTTLRFGELAEEAAKLPVPADPPLKPADLHEVVGTSPGRLDTRDKVMVEATFGIDVDVPDMLVGAIAHAPAFGGAPVSWNEEAAKAVRGVKQVVALEHALVVVADTYWQARKGLAALEATWTPAAGPILTTADAEAALVAALDAKGKVAVSGATTLDVEYHAPWLAHATMEPQNATVHVQADRIDVWAPVQGQTLPAQQLAKALGRPLGQVFVHPTFLGGGFGRRGEADFVVEAGLVSAAVGRPVKLIWSREEDTRHDFYRPMATSRFQIALGPDGTPAAWHTQLASSSILQRLQGVWFPSYLAAIPFTTLVGDPIQTEGIHVPYADASVSQAIVDLPVPVGFWRSVGHSHNGFFTESVIDECAHLAGEDPVAYRQRLLADAPRDLAVLQLVADKAGWGQAPAGRFQGVAVHPSFGSHCAMVAEVSLDREGRYRLHKVTAAFDCGVAVHPEQVRRQIEGGIVYALTAAQYGKIDLNDGAVVQSNFHDYPMLRMSHMPDVEVHLLASGEAPGGAGEPGVPPLAPAVTNALFAATGKRVRRLPLIDEGFELVALRG